MQRRCRNRMPTAMGCTLPNIDRASMRVVALIDNFATFVCYVACVARLACPYPNTTPWCSGFILRAALFPMMPPGWYHLRATEAVTLDK